MRIRLISLAQTELDEAIKFYEHQLPGLGIRFFNEIKKAVDRICFMPEAYYKIGENTRRCLLKAFPYAIHYVIENEERIIITALAHLHRDPERFKGRTV